MMKNIRSSWATSRNRCPQICTNSCGRSWFFVVLHVCFEFIFVSKLGFICFYCCLNKVLYFCFFFAILCISLRCSWRASEKCNISKWPFAEWLVEIPRLQCTRCVTERVKASLLRPWSHDLGSTRTLVTLYNNNLRLGGFGQAANSIDKNSKNPREHWKLLTRCGFLQARSSHCNKKAWIVQTWRCPMTRE